MMMQRLVLAAAVALVCAGTATAQYVGPGASKVFNSIAEVLRDAPDDARVELEGYLVRQVGKEKYIFSDGRDEIRVEIEDEDFPSVRVDAQTRLRIRGEVEREFLQSPEIDVDHLAVL